MVYDGTNGPAAGPTAQSLEPQAHDHHRTMQAEKLAHDLGNYLTAISGLAQVGRLLKVAEAKDAYLMRIESAVEDMARMIREILASRPTDLRELTDAQGLRDLVQEIAGLLQPQFAAKGVTLLVQVGRGIPPCRLARTPFKQVLVNLMDNALRATPAGGRVTLKVGPAKSPAGAHIRVEDTGVGIPKQQLSQVCKPGYTTRADGYGLGLSVTQEIVEIMHGGRLCLRSRTGAGTTVHIYLPC